MARVFRDRSEAGQALASRLTAYARRPGVIVLALPRGGVPVAFQVAVALQVPLDVFIVRKLGVPGQEELAMGAIASGGVRVLNEDVIAQLDIPREVVDSVTWREQMELERREHRYRNGRPPPDLAGRTVILVDDGIATGSTMRVAVVALRQQQPARTVIAVPVAPRETCAELRGYADEMVCLLEPEDFYAVGFWYEDFSPVSDEEVLELMEKVRQRLPM